MISIYPLSKTGLFRYTYIASDRGVSKSEWEKESRREKERN